MKNSGAVIDHRFQKNNSNIAEKFFLFLSRGKRYRCTAHRHLFPIRRTRSRGWCSRNTTSILCARLHTHARAHACTVFIDLGPGGNTRFMVSSTTRAGSKFQRGGNSAQITTLWIVCLLVPAFKSSFLSLPFFLRPFLSPFSLQIERTV